MGLAVIQLNCNESVLVHILWEVIMSKVDSVKAYIVDQIDQKNILRGQRLPSCREISKILAVNKITVNKAFQMLESEHVVYVIPRGGYYLVDRPNEETISRKVTDFRGVTPEKRLIPFQAFSHAMNKAIELYKERLFCYEDAKGLLALRKTLADFFMKDGIYTDAENIMVTHGAQQAIHLIFNHLSMQNGAKILVEVPTYSLPLRIAEKLNIEVVGIERKCTGIDMMELERVFRDEQITAFYMIPRHHNPTGFTLTEKDKKTICQLANQYNVLIIEDDYLADLGSKATYLPFHYYDTDKKSVYIRSFSKTFMPGLRLGAAVLPNYLMTKISELKYLSDLNTAQLPQAALDIFIKSGMYARHVAKIRAVNASKLRKAHDVSQSQCPSEIKMFIPSQGIFIWCELPKDYDFNALLERLSSKDIIISDSSDYYHELLSPETRYGMSNNIRLCISSLSEDELANGLATFFSVFRSMTAQSEAIK